ncbi:MAG: HD-GYP domain-containing protein [Candidatus Zixiibacteriota bacterium]|nr:MAG: HD-GYP domain-containing protein [candidate division Zixibacteria bacterium]
MVSEIPVKSREPDKTALQKRQLLEKGKSLVSQLCATIRTAQIYDRSNSVYVRQAESLLGLIQGLLEGTGEFLLKSKEGYLFLNDTRLRFSFDGYVAGKFIVEMFRKLQFECIFFSPPLIREELDEFVFILAHADAEGEDPFENLQKRVASSNIEHLRVEKFAPGSDLGDESEPEGQKKQAKKRFFKTLLVAQETMESAKSKRSINTVKSKRAIQFLIDQLIKDEGKLMSLTAIKSFDEYTFAHSVNVCILSVALGTRLGLSKGELSELGFAALFHDVGKVRLPIELLNKPGELTEEEWVEVKKHPIFGVKALLSRRSIDRFCTRAMVVSFEHHLKLDHTGYPETSAQRDLDLFSRIVTIVDVYDSMTSGRVYARTPLTPDEALRRMLQKQGKSFDAALLKVFINMLGIYPVGSVVILDTGEIGVVMEANPAELSCPEVAIIADRFGKREKVETVDLTKLDEKTGKHTRTILRTIDPHGYKLEVARYIY